MKRAIIVWLAALALALTALGSPAAAESTADLYRQSYRYEAAGNPAAALSAMEKIAKQSSESYFVTARLAWLSHLAGRYPQAEQHYRKAIQLAPKAVEPRLGLTLPLLAAQKWRELEAASREVIKLDPKNAVARARLAHAQYSVGNYPDAAVVYRELVAEYPADLDHKTGLGWALLRMGRGSAAKDIFREVLAVSPDNPNAIAGMSAP